MTSLPRRRRSYWVLDQLTHVKRATSPSVDAVARFLPALLVRGDDPPDPPEIVAVFQAAGPPEPCRASWSSFSPSLDREVFSTVPPYLLIASMALSGVTFSTIRNRADVPGLSKSRTWSWKALSIPDLVTFPMSAPRPAPIARPKNGTKNSTPNSTPQNIPHVAPVPTG